MFIEQRKTDFLYIFSSQIRLREFSKYPISRAFIIVVNSINWLNTWVIQTDYKSISSSFSKELFSFYICTLCFCRGVWCRCMWYRERRTKRTREATNIYVSVYIVMDKTLGKKGISKTWTRKDVDVMSGKIPSSTSRETENLYLKHLFSAGKSNSFCWL